MNIISIAIGVVCLRRLVNILYDYSYRFAAGTLIRRKRKRNAEDEMMVDNEENDTSMELHLIPLHGITQLRPSYEYLGEYPNKRMAGNKGFYRLSYSFYLPQAEG